MCQVIEDPSDQGLDYVRLQTYLSSDTINPCIRLNCLVVCKMIAMILMS